MNKLNITQHFVFILVPNSTSSLLQPLVNHKMFEKLIPDSIPAARSYMSADIVAIALLANAHHVLCAENTIVSISAEANTVFIQCPIMDDVTAL